jgi:hypothetical protein
MLALFLNHPPLFVAGEIALGLLLTLFVGALIAAAVRGAPGIYQLWVKRSTLVRMFRASLWQRGRRFDPGRDPRCAKEAPVFEARRSRYAILNLGRTKPRKFPTKPSTARGSSPPPDQNAAQINGTAAESPGGRLL